MPSSKSTHSALFAVSLITLALTAVTPAHAGDDRPKFLSDTNLFGKDIRDFDLAEENPRLCYDACVADKSCRAFTYLRPHGWPGAGSTAHCWIKYAVPSDIRHENCCVSGIVRPGEDPAPRPPDPPKPAPAPPVPSPAPPPLQTIIPKEVKLDAFPPSYHGSCPVSIRYRASITVSSPGIVKYTFWHEGDTIGEPSQLQFEAAGTKEVWAMRDTGTPGKHENMREALMIGGYHALGACPSGIPCNPGPHGPMRLMRESAAVVTPLECDPKLPAQQAPKQGSDQ